MTTEDFRDQFEAIADPDERAQALGELEAYAVRFGEAMAGPMLQLEGLRKAAEEAARVAEKLFVCAIAAKRIWLKAEAASFDVGIRYQTLREGHPELAALIAAEAGMELAKGVASAV